MPPSHRRDVTETSGPSVDVVLELMRALARDGAAPHDEHCEDDIRAYGVNACTQAEILAAALLAAEQEAERRTVQEAARLVCDRCARGEVPFTTEQSRRYPGHEWLHNLYPKWNSPRADQYRMDCPASPLLARWPAYAPVEKP